MPSVAEELAGLATRNKAGLTLPAVVLVATCIPMHAVAEGLAVLAIRRLGYHLQL